MLALKIFLSCSEKKSEDGTESEPEIDDSYDDHGSAMGSVVDGDEFLDTFEETTDTTESYEWGENASYNLVKPTTKEQHRQAHMKAQENLQEPSNISENTFFSAAPSRTRGLKTKISPILAPKTSVSKAFFSTRVAALWNSFPQTAIDSPSKKAFKNHLSRLIPVSYLL